MTVARRPQLTSTNPVHAQTGAIVCGARSLPPHASSHRWGQRQVQRPGVLWDLGGVFA